MQIEFNGTVLFWRGPAPYFFVAVPEGPSREIKSISNLVTYGWGVIPVHARIGRTEFETSLFPKDGRYLLPLKAVVRKAENLAEGDEVTVQIEVN